MESASNREISDITKTLCTDKHNGLTDTQAIEKLRTYGINELPSTESTSFISLVIKQFKDLMVIVLLISAVISFILGVIDSNDSFLSIIIEPLVILLILIANAIVGVVQETNAEHAIKRLKEFQSKKSLVIRNGRINVIDSSLLVPGDLIKLSTGDRVPADCRIISIPDGSVLLCDESTLTGEALPVEKQFQTIPYHQSSVLQDLKNMAFCGSLVVKGRGFAIVTKTASHTELGKIHTQLKDIDDDNLRTPLQEKLDSFAEQLSKIIFIICVMVWIVNINHFTDPEHGGFLSGAIYYFKIAVSLAVAAIPEGLPAVVTTCLALGTKKMANKNAIVRTLPSVETLGCTTVICSDKTGTLTTNKFNVRSVFTIKKTNSSIHFGNFYISGVDFTPTKHVEDLNDGRIMVQPSEESFSLNIIGRISELCNEANLFSSKMKNGEKKFKVSGEATEIALKVLSRNLSPLNIHNSRRLRLLDFDHCLKMMSTVDLFREKECDEIFVHSKGAPESILRHCTHYMNDEVKEMNADSPSIEILSPMIREKILAKVKETSEKGFRLIAFAFKKYGSMIENDSILKMKRENLESDLIFLGICAMLDPPRKQVAAAINKCIQSGIKIVVITGDSQWTAESICRQVGIFGEGEDCKKDFKSITGKEFMAMTRAQKLKCVETTKLLSRVEPMHKLEMVQIFREKGHVVAMTGDGVNDAAALRCADIGIAMGSGTQVAQHASNMVLQDDNFSTIVDAIEEGRVIYANTKQFIRYLISSNFGEVACIFFVALLGIPEALIPVQLLWVNLVTDGLPATALGFNPEDGDIMSSSPRKRDENIIDGWMLFRYLIIGLYIGIATVSAFIWWFVYYSEGPLLEFSQLRNFHSCGTNNLYFPESFDCKIFHHLQPSTLALTVLVTIEMLNAFNAISENSSLFILYPWKNPYVIGAVLLSLSLHLTILQVPFFNEIFSTTPLNWELWKVVIIISLPVILIDEILKIITREKCMKKLKKKK